MTLTTTEIKTSLLLITTFDPPIKRINAYVEKNESHRKYPSIDIQNITGEEEVEGVPTITTKQVFLVHLYFRTEGPGADQEGKIKAAEDLIFNQLDTLQETTDFIQVVQSWDRKSETFPLSRVHSTLRVTSEAISSTSGSGIPGTGITISFPTNPLNVPVIDVLIDETGIIKDLDLTTTLQVYTKIRNNGLLSVVIAVSQSDEELIKTVIKAGDNFVLKYKKGSTSERELSVNPVSIVASGTRGEIQTQIVTVDVINS